MGIPRPGGDFVAPGKNYNVLWCRSRPGASKRRLLLRPSFLLTYKCSARYICLQSKGKKEGERRVKRDRADVGRRSSWCRRSSSPPSLLTSSIAFVNMRCLLTGIWAATVTLVGLTGGSNEKNNLREITRNHQTSRNELSSFFCVLSVPFYCASIKRLYGFWPLHRLAWPQRVQDCAAFLSRHICDHFELHKQIARIGRFRAKQY
jgi:hypothetical protein